jgi:serine/threonine protein kinase
MGRFRALFDSSTKKSLKDVLGDIQEELQSMRHYNALDQKYFITRSDVLNVLSDEKLHMLLNALKLPERKREYHLSQVKSSQLQVLALLVYGRREEVLRDVFGRWLSSPKQVPEFPADSTLPILRDQAERLFHRNASEILGCQPMFLPTQIRKGLNQQLLPGHCQPYEDCKELGKGASGCVFCVKIPPGYWLSVDELNETALRANKQHVLLAVKRFQEQQAITAASAYEHFKHETDFLMKLRKKGKSSDHEHILWDLGSLSVDSIHDLFYPLAECNLREFFEGKPIEGKVIEHYYGPVLKPIDKVELFQNAVDILHAVKFLHDNQLFHGDIKPDNILVFYNSRTGKISRKLADFNFSLEEKTKPPSLLELSKAFRSPSEPQKTNWRVKGIFQPPEVRELCGQFGQPSMKGDVWSIGCALLMDLSFQDNKSIAVKEDLYSRLQHPTRDGSIYLSFYTTPEAEANTLTLSEPGDRSTPKWVQIDKCANQKLPPQEAAIHPPILAWMDELCNRAKGRDKTLAGEEGPEAKFIDRVTKYLRAGVIIVPYADRVTAKDFHHCLQEILDEFQKELVANLGENSKQNEGGDNQFIVTPNKDDQGAEPKLDTSGHGQICSAVRNLNYERFAQLCETNSVRYDNRCNKCQEYPIHLIILKEDEKLLQILLRRPDLESINARRSSCHRNALELACEVRVEKKYLMVEKLLKHPKIELGNGLYEKLKAMPLKTEIRLLLKKAKRR